MGCLGNLIWFICGGLWQGLCWMVAGILWCITIIGIPIGTQCFKFASLAFFPFGKEIEYGGGAMSLLANILWLVLSGIPLALSAAVNGVLLCCTIIGIPVRAAVLQDCEACADALRGYGPLAVSPLRKNSRACQPPHASLLNYFEKDQLLHWSLKTFISHREPPFR